MDTYRETRIGILGLCGRLAALILFLGVSFFIPWYGILLLAFVGIASHLLGPEIVLVGYILDYSFVSNGFWGLPIFYSAVFFIFIAFFAIVSLRKKGV